MDNCITVLLCAVIVPGSALAASLTPQPSPSEEYHLLPGGGWLKLHRDAANWLQAHLACQIEGGVPASPLTPQLAEALRVSARGLPGLLTGLRATARENYTTADGSALDSAPLRWAPVQPTTRAGAARCLAVLHDGTLTASDCNQKLPFACYRENTTAPGNVTTVAPGSETTVAQGSETAAAPGNVTTVAPESETTAASGSETTAAPGTENTVAPGRETTVAPRKTCGSIYNEYMLDERTGSCYKLHRVASTWSGARLACAAEGAQLVVINSEAEAQAVRNLFAQYPYHLYPVMTSYGKSSAFAGFSKASMYSEWITIHGESLQQAGYSRFGPGEQDSETRETEFCGAVNSAGLLADHLCDKAYRYICEKLPHTWL